MASVSYNATPFLTAAATLWQQRQDEKKAQQQYAQQMQLQKMTEDAKGWDSNKIENYIRDASMAFDSGAAGDPNTLYFGS